ncbi:MAG: hypothetical protein IKU37_06500 [Candidatus Gastranaerophilales bacterium]|nr:hypothetical protein [Candidatus Gastranaerophilales bacterium]
MKVYSIVNNSYKINAYKGNIHLTSFMGTDEVNIQKPKSQKATLTQKITASLAKIKSDKYVKLSKDLLHESDQIKTKATSILMQAQEVQQISKELLDANSEALSNNRVPRSQALIVYDCCPDDKKTDAYVFDTKTRVLKQYMKNVNMNDSCTNADECYTFDENGKLVAYDSFFVETEAGCSTYAKSFERYLFNDGDIRQYYSQYNETIDKTISFDDVLMFDQGEPLYYVENGYIDTPDNVKTFGLQMVFDNEQIKLCSNGLKVYPDGGQECRKHFVYSNGKLEQVQFDAQMINSESVSSRQAFEFVDDKPYCCRINDDSGNETVTYFKK